MCAANKRSIHSGCRGRKQPLMRLRQIEAGLRDKLGLLTDWSWEMRKNLKHEVIQHVKLFCIHLHASESTQGGSVLAATGKKLASAEILWSRLCKVWRWITSSIRFTEAMPPSVLDSDVPGAQTGRMSFDRLVNNKLMSYYQENQ